MSTDCTFLHHKERTTAGVKSPHSCALLCKTHTFYLLLLHIFRGFKMATAFLAYSNIATVRDQNSETNQLMYSLNHFVWPDSHFKLSL